MSFDFSKALQELASFRIKNSRRSQEVVDLGLALLAKSRRKASSNSIASTSSGSSILASSGIASLEEDSAWIEQLELAAIDVGRLDIADVS